MAKKRRSYQVNSSDYNIAGGGGGASGGNVRFTQKDTQAVAIGGSGILYTPGTKQVARPIKTSLEAGLQVTNQQRTDSTVYFEHAFENLTATPSQVTDADELPSGYGTTFPTGMSMDTDSDSGDGDHGYVRIAQTTIDSNATVGTYKFRYKVDQGGWGASYIDYEVEVWPTGTTPTQTNSSLLTSQIIRNQAAKQYLTDTITGTQIVQFTVKNATGFPTGVSPKIETDGRVYVENVGDILQASAGHSFVVEVDLGQYGKYEFTYTGSIAYGDPYGARYWGPGNAYRNPSAGDYVASGTASYQDGSYWFNYDIQAGAIGRQRGNTDQYDTSPYNYGTYNTYDNGKPIGLRQVGGISSDYQLASSPGASNPNGMLGGRNASGYWNANSQSSGQYIRVKWIVPNGVTNFAVVAVGAGAPGAYNWAADGGGAGGLAYVNAVTCTPGEEFYVQIGMSLYPPSSNQAYYGGDTYLMRVTGSEYIVYCYGAGYYQRQSQPGSNGSWSQYSYSGDQRDSGGAYASNQYGTHVAYRGGYANQRSGAGAGGYQGVGSNSNDYQNNGGGGGGQDYSSTYGNSAGGGTGLDGIGHGGYNNTGSGYNGSWNYTSVDNGVAAYAYAGGGGSGGGRGSKGEDPSWSSNWIQNRYITGGMHGAGGGGSGTSWGGGAGGPGGLRIIWGAAPDGNPRSFPKHYTTEDKTWKHPY